MKKTIVLLMVTVMLSLWFGAAHRTTEAAEVKTLKLGNITFLSGPAAPWGIPISRALSMGISKINDRGGFQVGNTTYKWEQIDYDSKYIPAEAVKAANKAIYGDKVNFITMGGGALVVACTPLIKENNILLMHYAGGGKAVSNPNLPLFFRYNPAIEGMYAAFLPFLMKREGIKTMAVINPDDETGRSGVDAARLGAGIHKVKIVAEEYFERGSKELTPLLTRIVAKNPDLIETSYTDPATSALICKQAREVGFKGTILLSWSADPKQVITIGGVHAEKVYMADPGPLEPQTPAQKEFYNRFLVKWPASEWDVVYWLHPELVPCLTKAIVETQSFDSFKLAKYLENMTWDSPMGTLSFGGAKIFGIKRQLNYPLSVLQIQKGKPVYLGTPPVPPGILD